MWDQKWGGDIELWSEDHLSLIRKIPCFSNDAALFETSEISFHQVTPISNDAKRKRRALWVVFLLRE